MANVEPIIGGPRGDAGLTDRGRRQAELLGARLRAEGFRADVLYASTLPRARETARYVSEALALPIREDDDLQELRTGAADGLSVAEWSATYPGLDRGPASRPFQPFATGGESWAAFLVRAGGRLAGLVADHPGRTVVAVTHGGVIDSSFYLAAGLGPTTTPVGFAAANTSLTHWRHDPADDPGWTLVSFNDNRHLADEESGEPPRPAVPTAADPD